MVLIPQNTDYLAKISKLVNAGIFFNSLIRNPCSFIIHFKINSSCFYGALKLEVAIVRIIFDDVTTTISCIVKWYSSIVAYQNLGIFFSIMARTLWTPETLDLLGTLVSQRREIWYHHHQFPTRTIGRPSLNGITSVVNQILHLVSPLLFLYVLITNFKPPV